MASSFDARSGAKPPSSPTAVDRPRSCSTLLERVVRLHAPAQRLAEARRADRHDHELLEVDVVVGVDAAVEDVHHRHRQHVGVGPADVAVERQLQLGGGGPGHGQGDAEDGVGAEAGLVVGAVEGDQLGVDDALVERVEALDGVGDLAVDVADGVEHALAAGSGRRRRAARPPRARRSRRPTARWPGRVRRCRAAPRPRRWGCPRVEDLARHDLLDLAHGRAPPRGSRAPPGDTVQRPGPPAVAWVAVACIAADVRARRARS